jgi:hypothetical protein
VPANAGAYVGVCVLKTLKQILILIAAGMVLTACSDDGSSSMEQSTASTSSSTSTSTSPSSPTSGSATLSWQAPTTDTNGSALTNLAGYRIYYGENASQLDQSIQLNSVGTQTYVIDNLAQGTWYFAIRAVTSSGVESALSDVVSLTIS